MWSLTAAVGRLRRHGHEGLEGARQRSTEQMYGEVFGAVSQVPGLQVFPRLDPPLPTPGQYDVELVLQSDAPPEQMLQTVGPGRRRRLAERQVPLRGHRPQDRPARGARRDRSRAGGRPRPRPGQRRAGAGHAARRRLRQPLQLLRPQLQGHPADRRRGPRDASARCSTSRSRRRAGELVPVSTFTRIETSTAPRTLQPVPAAERGAGLRRREAGRHQGRGAARAGDRGGRRRAGPAIIARLRRRVAADPPGGRGADGHARVRGDPDLPGARGAVPELPRSADRAARARCRSRSRGRWCSASSTSPRSTSTRRWG